MKKVEIIPRGLAFDLLFGSNSHNDKHAVIEEIYEGFYQKIKKLEDDRDYWKLSFKKQCEATK